MSMKKRIYGYIQKVKGGVTFVELARNVDGFSGDLETGILEKNIIFWQGVSVEAVEALRDLNEEKKVKICPTSTFTYMVDGGVLNLPLVKQNRAYKEPHWLPIVFNLSSQDGVYIGANE